MEQQPRLLANTNMQINVASDCKEIADVILVYNAHLKTDLLDKESVYELSKRISNLADKEVIKWLEGKEDQQSEVAIRG